MPNTTKPYKTHMQSQKRMSLYDKKTGSQMFQDAVSKQSRIQLRAQSKWFRGMNRSRVIVAPI